MAEPTVDVLRRHRASCLLENCERCAELDDVIAAVVELIERAGKVFDLANHFNVSGVYFTQDSENYAALLALETSLRRVGGAS